LTLREDGLLPLLARRASETPDAVALVDVAGTTLTCAEVDTRIRQWAAAYRRLGLEPGETVVTMLPNSFDAYFAWLGAAAMRAVEVPINNMHRGQMLEYVLADSGARVAVISERFVDRLAGIAIGQLDTVVVPDAAAVPEPTAAAVSVVGPADFFAPPPADDLPAIERWDVAAMIYTSGTTGPSKGVLVPWGQMLEMVRFLPEDMVDEDRGFYSTYPAFHLSGKSGLYASTCHSGRLVIRETFSVSGFLDDLRTHDCVAAGLLGPMAAMLMRQPEKADDGDTPLRHVAMGPLIPGVEDFVRRFGVKVCTGYAMTEIGAPIASGWNLANGTSCGRRREGFPGYEVRVVDDHDVEVAPGTVGELLVRADAPWTMSLGYWNKPEQTATAWRNGWFHTGDAFVEDEHGNFTFVDRIKDAIRRRGENISSFEVEAGVLQHPAVRECAAVAVPSELTEDEVKICVVLEEGMELGPQELITWLLPRMSDFMVPRYVEFVDALPKTDATQRTRKIELRRDPLTSRTWDRVAAELPSSR
jgi:crotonobetaine/carnitine-CoA ligase